MEVTCQVSTTFVGKLPDDPDDLPNMAPSGFIWMASGALEGATESYGVTVVRVSHDGDRLDFVMTLADALSLRSRLDQAIETMRNQADDEQEIA